VGPSAVIKSRARWSVQNGLTRIFLDILASRLDPSGPANPRLDSSRVPLRSPERVPKSGLLHACNHLAHRFSKNVANDKSTGRALRIAASRYPIADRHRRSSVR
jgi:hypothetical protein